MTDQILESPSLEMSSISLSDIQCTVCKNVYSEPVLLKCFHSFCKKCVQINYTEKEPFASCPVCGKKTYLSGEETELPKDALLVYIIDSGLFNVEKDYGAKSALPDEPTLNCGNCDEKATLYCQQCESGLCNNCNTTCHSARMFSTHHVIPATSAQLLSHKKCPLHDEDYIFFSPQMQTLLCIGCYRNLSVPKRAECMDLETAVTKGNHKLRRSFHNLLELQRAVRDGITMLKAVLQELRRNSESEKSALNAVCETIVGALSRTQNNIIRDLQYQTSAKAAAFLEHLSHLRSVLPMIKLHLTMTAAVSRSSQQGQKVCREDFLKIAYPLIDRLMHITNVANFINGRPARIDPHISGNIHGEIARTLEPWVGHFRHMSDSKSYIKPNGHKIPMHPQSGNDDPYATYFHMRDARNSVTKESQIRPPNNVDVFNGSKAMEELRYRLTTLTSSVHELQANLNKIAHEFEKEGIIKRINALQRESNAIQLELNKRHSQVENIRRIFQQYWHTKGQMMGHQENLFRSQMEDLSSLQNEVKRVMILLQQIHDLVVGQIHSQQITSFQSHPLQTAQVIRHPPPTMGTPAPPVVRRESAVSQRLTRSQAYTLHYQHTRGSKSSGPKLPSRQNSLISNLLGKVRGGTPVKKSNTGATSGANTFPQRPSIVTIPPIVTTAASTFPFRNGSHHRKFTLSDAACQHLPVNPSTSAVAALALKSSQGSNVPEEKQCKSRNGNEGCRSEDEGRVRARAKSAGQMDNAFRCEYMEYLSPRRVLNGNNGRLNGSFTISHPPHYRGSISTSSERKPNGSNGGKENGRRRKKKHMTSSPPEDKMESSSSDDEHLRVRKKRAQRSQSVPPEHHSPYPLGVITPPLNYVDKSKCTSLPRVGVGQKLSSGDETDSIVTVKRAHSTNGGTKGQFSGERSVSTPVLLSPGEGEGEPRGFYGKKASSLVFAGNLGGEHSDRFFGTELRKHDSFEGHEEAIESLVRVLKGSKAKKYKS